MTWRFSPEPVENGVGISRPGQLWAESGKLRFPHSQEGYAVELPGKALAWSLDFREPPWPGDSSEPHQGGGLL